MGTICDTGIGGVDSLNEGMLRSSQAHEPEHFIPNDGYMSYEKFSLALRENEHHAEERTKYKERSPASEYKRNMLSAERGRRCGVIR